MDFIGFHPGYGKREALARDLEGMAQAGITVIPVLDPQKELEAVVPLERLVELEAYHDYESSDPATQEWRDSLTSLEAAIVDGWDREYARAYSIMADRIFLGDIRRKFHQVKLLEEPRRTTELVRLMKQIEARFQVLMVNPTAEDMQKPEVVLWREIGDAREM